MLLSVPFLALPLLIVASPIQKRASYSVLAESSGLANSTVPTTSTVFPESTATASRSGSGSNFTMTATSETPNYSIHPASNASFAGSSSPTASGPAVSGPAFGNSSAHYATGSSSPTASGPAVSGPAFGNSSAHYATGSSSPTASGPAVSGPAFGNSSAHSGSGQSGRPKATVYFTTDAPASPTPLPGSYFPSNGSSAGESSAQSYYPNAPYSPSSDHSSNFSSTVIASFTEGNATASGQHAAQTTS